MVEHNLFDLAIIGGGINGAGIARDAAGRGLSVLLVEQGDLASGTSSHSSRLIHGGLRYLETYQVRLVREALSERDTLMTIAPHLVRPLRFVLPHTPGVRARWKVAAGLWLYDRLGGAGTLPRSGTLDLAQAVEGRPLRPHFRTGFHYTDCQTEDARLVVVNAVDAARRGATILTRTRLEGASVTEGGVWRLRLGAVDGASRQEVGARVVINAAGPWVEEVDSLLRPSSLPTAASSPAPLIRKVKGSHLVVPRLYPGDHAYLCQNTDGRVVFFLPLDDDLTLIGTTDVPVEGDPASARCSAEEEAYLLAVAHTFFRQPPSALSVIHRFAGVRALYDDGKPDARRVTRDYVLSLREAPAPLLTLLGGKLTTHRRLAEWALERLRPFFPTAGGAWTGTEPLPGGRLEGTPDAFRARMQTRFPWLPPALHRRWCRQYGSEMETLLNGATSLADLGPDLAPGLPDIEADYLRRHEFARTLEDMLWRRTGLGIRTRSSPTPLS